MPEFPSQPPSPHRPSVGPPTRPRVQVVSSGKGKKKPQAELSPARAAFWGGLIGAAVMFGLLLALFNFSEPAVVKQALSANGSAATPSEIYREYGNGVVSVSNSERSGTGFVIDESGLVVTNAHVVEGKGQIIVHVGDQQLPATLRGTDTSSDLALLQVKSGADKLTVLQLGNSSQLEVGEPVTAIGNPLGLDHTVTSGIVSALNRQISSPNGFQIDKVVQTDAAINPGNSGGPLLDDQGRVIGINSQIATSEGSKGSIGIGFAIPVDTLRSRLTKLERGNITYAYMGVSAAPVDKAQAKRLKAPRGVLIVGVRAGSPAAKAGLLGSSVGKDNGDIILQINQRNIRTAEGFSATIDTFRPGDVVTVKLWRAGKLQNLKVKLEDRPSAITELLVRR